jgi:thiamine transport system ATP-binding protein
VVQTGTPEVIYNQPGSEFVARFLGFKNIFPGTLGNGQLITPFGQFPFSLESDPPGPRDCIFLLRPDTARISGKSDHQIDGTVQERSFRGGLSHLQVEAGSTSLYFEFQSGQDLPAEGETIFLTCQPQHTFQILSWTSP